MIDSHCHVARGEERHIICEPFSGNVREGDAVFYGTHPWEYLNWDGGERLRNLLASNASAGVGEIGLDRLKERDIPTAMREVFAQQLEIAAEFRRPVVLHGAKCWGEVVKACIPFAGIIPAFLFHGFSRSGGLLPAIRQINGYVSVGGAVMNDHAVNYRRLVQELPAEMLLLESDATAANRDELPCIGEILAKVAQLRGIDPVDLDRVINENARRFLGTF